MLCHNWYNPWNVQHLLLRQLLQWKTLNLTPTLTLTVTPILILILTQGWDGKYLKKEEDNLARERIDRAGGGSGPPPTLGTFGIFPPFFFRNNIIRGNPRRNLMPAYPTRTKNAIITLTWTLCCQRYYRWSNCRRSKCRITNRWQRILSNFTIFGGLKYLQAVRNSSQGLDAVWYNAWYNPYKPEVTQIIVVCLAEGCNVCTRHKNWQYECFACSRQKGVTNKTITI